jgi:hypothetical protein
MVFITQTGWTYSEIFKLPIKKRDWMFKIYNDMVKKEEEELSEEEG